MSSYALPTISATNGVPRRDSQSSIGSNESHSQSHTHRQTNSNEGLAPIITNFRFPAVSEDVAHDHTDEDHVHEHPASLRRHSRRFSNNSLSRSFVYSPGGVSASAAASTTTVNGTGDAPRPDSRGSQGSISLVYGHSHSHSNSHGHSHTHSHGHGHSHSHSHSHSPSPSCGGHTHSPSVGHSHSPSCGGGHGHGHGHSPSISHTHPPSGHSHSHSHLHDHDHDHGHSHEHTHAPLQKLLVPPFLVTLTLLSASLAFSSASTFLSHPHQHALPESELSEAETHSLNKDALIIDHPEPTSRFLAACALSSGSLLVSILIGIVTGGGDKKPAEDTKNSLSKGKAEVAPPFFSRQSQNLALRRALGVMLPFLAAFELGGSRAAALLLAACASGLSSGFGAKLPSFTFNEIKDLFTKKWVFLTTFTSVAFLDLFAIGDVADMKSTFIGYVALSFSLFAFPPPIPSKNTASITKRSELSTTVIAAIMLCVPVLALPFLFSTYTLGFTSPGWYLIAIVAAGVAYTGLGSDMGIQPTAAIYGIVAAFLGGWIEEEWLIRRGALEAAIAASIAGVLYVNSQKHSHSHKGQKPGKITERLLSASRNWPIVNAILSDPDSRKIFYFMLLNFCFMLVQTLYGFLTGSLGLLSDSIHMLLDCLALAVGLAAAVMSKWPPSTTFPYGLGKIETLAGFANGILLFLISLEIIFEAFQRLWGSDGELERLDELLVVSAAGLVVNLVGIMAFDHGHAHHGHSHGHSHDHHNENLQGIFLHILADALGSLSVTVSTLLVKYTGYTFFDPIASVLIAVLIGATAFPLVFSSAQRLLLAVPEDVEFELRDKLSGLSGFGGVVGYKGKFWLGDSPAEEEKGKHDHDHHHDHDHDHDHHGHGHGHDHGHDHSHGHDHGHGCDSSNILGVIHIAVDKGTDENTIREKVKQHLGKRMEKVLVQVEKVIEGGISGCWCGISQSNNMGLATPRHGSFSVNGGYLLGGGGSGGGNGGSGGGGERKDE
ncbi:putative zinc transporter msc2 [Orbilia oligospora]|uniref:Zinc transporter n=1 Tax=Orbilia oligospora TaxID=2813651 RepID=A0A8H8V817_ORBOL|nr:putative zinc transporter msc2 [Orbilia oligospora]